MVSEYEIKKQICDIGKRIYDRGMVAANDGNISVKIGENEIHIMGIGRTVTEEHGPLAQASARAL